MNTIWDHVKALNVVKMVVVFTAIMLKTAIYVVRFPTDQDRTMVIGGTGSGKTQFSMDLLATANWAPVDDPNSIPWVIMDYKGEDLILDLVEAARKCGFPLKEIKVTDKPPKVAGLYYMKVRPLIDDDAVELWLQRAYEQTHIGIYLDEGFALPRYSKFFDIILTQGRSLHIPVICLYQRANFMTRFARSQSTFRACFSLEDDSDKKIAKEIIRPAKGANGEEYSVFTDLPDYHCLWYDVGRKTTTVLKPASSRQVIINFFLNRLRPIKRRALV